VNVETGEFVVVYQGALSNSSLYSGVIGLLASGLLDELFAGLE
jgi:hypothetical protein